VIYFSFDYLQAGQKASVSSEATPAKQSNDHLQLNTTLHPTSCM